LNRQATDGDGPHRVLDGDAALNAADVPRHLYIHVPFCRKRCDYCSFYSVDDEAVGRHSAEGTGRGQRERFIEAAHAEWAAEAAHWGVGRLETLYVGGGTPSTLGVDGLEGLLSPLLDGTSPAGARAPLMTARAEVTVETNPEDVSPDYARWAAARRLRVSLGVQSFDRRLRERLGRRAAADPVAVLHRLRAAGVANLSVDLIFGVPGQSPADVDRELCVIAELRPDHVSWYELEIAPGTALARRLDAGDAPERDARPDEAVGDESQVEPYRRIVAGLRRLGYDWYEVSNFALPGRRSRHNLGYWRGRPYLGLGPSAVSTVGDQRWRNVADVGRYVGAWTKSGIARRPPLAACPRDARSTVRDGNLRGGHREDRARETEHLDVVTRARERLFLAARIGARVDLSELDPALDRAALQPLAEGGFISLHGGTLSVTRKGRYVANEVCVRLFATAFSRG
jgi:oxygen-independent coproporphyrinogen-3 oxidase